jgi:hypothetical protein
VRLAERKPSASVAAAHADAGCIGIDADAEARRFAAGGRAVDFHDRLLDPVSITLVR